MSNTIIIWISVTFLFILKCRALDNGIATTPQMGWNAWNAFGCDVSEDLILQTAELIVEYGLRDLGYHYVVLDDCWSAGRSANKTLMADPVKFPKGIRALGEQLHTIGLGLGIYADSGEMTCALREGSLGFEAIDAQSFADWGVDYLKYDNCFNEGEAGTQLVSYNRYAKMSEALNATGRPILFSICNWGEDYPWLFASTIANSWRMSGDIWDTFDKYDVRCPCEGVDAYACRNPNGIHCSVTNILNKAAFIARKGRPGAWNDLDMLEVGNGGMTDAEYKTHFSAWAALKTPLIMGTDLRVVDAQALSILNNPAVIAINQDTLGSPVARRWILPSSTGNKREEIQLWSGKLTSTTGGIHNDMVVLLINGGSSSATMTATLMDVFDDLAHSDKMIQVVSSWEVRDLWAKRMSITDATSIIQGTTTWDNITSGGDEWYNATQTSFAQGLAANDARVLGVVDENVLANGIITTSVEAHGVAMFRLRNTGSLKKMDEL